MRQGKKELNVEGKWNGTEQEEGSAKEAKPNLVLTKQNPKQTQTRSDEQKTKKDHAHEEERREETQRKEEPWRKRRRKKEEKPEEEEQGEKSEGQEMKRKEKERGKRRKRKKTSENPPPKKKKKKKKKKTLPTLVNSQKIMKKSRIMVIHVKVFKVKVLRKNSLPITIILRTEKRQHCNGREKS